MRTTVPPSFGRAGRREPLTVGYLLTVARRDSLETVRRLIFGARLLTVDVDGLHGDPLYGLENVLR